MSLGLQPLSLIFIIYTHNMTHITINSQSLITINPLKPKNCLPTSGKLHKIPHVTYSLEPICGSVAVIGDLTKPFSIKFKIRDKRKSTQL